MFIRNNILGNTKLIACHYIADLTFLGRRWESKELSLEEIAQARDWPCSLMSALIPVFGEWQKLMACA